MISKFAIWGRITATAKVAIVNGVLITTSLALIENTIYSMERSPVCILHLKYSFGDLSTLVQLSNKNLLGYVLCYYTNIIC